jgi:hypothetical protein
MVHLLVYEQVTSRRVAIASVRPSTTVPLFPVLIVRSPRCPKNRANLEKKGVGLEEIPEDPTGYEVNPEYQRGKLLEGESDDMRDPIMFDARTAMTATGHDG